MSWRSRWRALALGGALLAAAPPAAANGRFPASTQLVIHPTDPQQLLLRVTFGLLLSRDGGKTFSWVCEAAVGYGGNQDPAVGLTSQGAVMVAAFEGLSTSLDQGCSFAFVPQTADDFVIDVAVDKQRPSSALALTSTGKDNDPSQEGPLRFRVHVVETLDDGATWSLIGSAVDDTVLAETIDPAPSRPERLYVSGVTVETKGGQTTRQGALMVSDDRGQTWTRRDIDLQGDRSVYIAAVDPVDPDRVYLRTSSLDQAQDRLLLTTDAGQTVQQVGSVPGSMLGFALSPDGSRVAIGGPTAGVLVADTTTFAFSQTSAIEAACLAWSPAGLHACGNAFKDGFALARSPDEGKTWEPILGSFRSLTGPIAGCASEPGPASVCAQEWLQLKATLGITEGGAGQGGQGGGGQGGQSGTSLQGGASGAGVPGGGAGGAAAGAAGASGGDDGCGCRQAGGGGRAGGALGLLAAAGLAAGGRRGRRAAAGRGRRCAWPVTSAAGRRR